MRHRLRGLSTYGLSGLSKADEHPEGCGTLYVFVDITGVLLIFSGHLPEPINNNNNLVGYCGKKTCTIQL